MNMNNHTPGPWEAGPDRCVYRGTEDVATVRHAYDICLIAAAPDLYEALRELAEFNNDYGNDYLRMTGSYSAFDAPHTVKTAREALAKVQS